MKVKMVKKLSIKVFFIKFIQRLLVLFFINFSLISCADKKESAQSCSVQLDEQKFSTVSENLERGTSSSISFHCSARLPRNPSATVQK